MKSFVFASAAVLLFAFTISTVSAQEDTKYDILLKNGHVIDPANSINKVTDVAVRDGKIARIDKAIPPGDAEQTIDVSGYYLTPGFIDIHVHLFYTFFIGAARSVIPDDHSFSSGVTTFVDAGTSGADNFEEFLVMLDQNHSRTQTRVLAFINISRSGMDEGEQDPAKFDVPALVAMAKKYPDIIVGFKTAHYWTGRPYDEIHQPWASVDSLLKAGRLAGLPVMIDFAPRLPIDGYPARSYRELILEKMRPGDIHTHCYAMHIPSIREDGTVNPDILKAQKRGVIFDVGHGAGSIVYKHAIPAIKQGYLPNTISTDIHGLNTWNGKVVNMINVMSKFLNMGLSLEDVIQRSTINPARVINRPDLGNLSVGSPADIAVIELLKGKFGYIDVRGGKIIGDKKIQCVMTVFDGKIIYDPNGFGFPEWQNIPKDSDYWKPPAQKW